MARPQQTAKQMAQKRKELLDTAQALYEARGAEGMSFRAIASANGCSATKPYMYFDSKADLIDGLRVRAYEWMRDQLDQAATSSGDALEALREVATAYVRSGLERPRMYELMYSQDGAKPETSPALLEAKLAAIGVCRRCIVNLAAVPGVELTEDPDTAAHLFWVSAHGLVSLEHGGFLVVGRSIEQLLSAVIVNVFRGITQGDFELLPNISANVCDAM